MDIYVQTKNGSEFHFTEKDEKTFVKKGEHFNALVLCFHKEFRVGDYICMDFAYIASNGCPSSNRSFLRSSPITSIKYL